MSDDLREWGAPEYVSEEGFAVAFQRGDEVVATAVTAGDGTFSLAVPAAPTPQDRVLVLTTTFRNGALVLAAANPGARRRLAPRRPASWSQSR